MNLLADIKFECSRCGQRLVVESSAAGLNTDCPSCRAVLEVPPHTSRHLLPEPETEDTEAHLLRQELAGATLLATERDREMAVLHEKLMMARREASEHRAERARLAATVVEKAAAFAELEAQYGDVHRELHAEAKARAELHEAREIARQLATAQAAQLSSREREAAEALATAGGLKDELRALEGRLGAVESELAQARVHLEEKAKLEQRVAELHDKELEAEMLARTCAQLREETGMQKRQLKESKAGRELLALRDRLRSAEEEAARAERAASHAAADVAKLRLTLSLEQGNLDLLRKRCESAEKRAESNSESASESLRGIVERQKKELLEQYVVVGRLRRAQYATRLVYGFVVLAIMSGVAGAILWVQHSTVLAEWFR